MERKELALDMFQSLPSLKEEERIDISLESMCYRVPGKNKGETRDLLCNINAYFPAGSLCMLIGGSGAGKTSLLNVIANETRSGFLEGELKVNGKVVRSVDLREASGFVFQDDVILDTMTVKEAVSLSAILRLPREMPQEEKLARADSAIRELRLSKAKDTYIGSSLQKGMSYLARVPDLRLSLILMYAHKVYREESANELRSPWSL
jgi:ATP-binding cassette subfamily G (WHITE) protein 1